MPTSRCCPRLAAGILLLVTALGACSSSGSRAAAPRAFDPERAADRLRALGRIDTAGHVRYGDRSGPVTGRIGYDPYRFRVRTTIPTGGAERRATFTGVGNRAWVTRAAVAGSDDLPASGPLLLVLRRAEAPPTIELPAAAGTVAPDATGPYTTVVETTAAGIPVRVLSAPGDTGWTCWKVESEPPFRGLVDPGPSGGTCAAPVDAGSAPEDAYAIPLMAAADTPYTLLGLVVPPGAVVEFRRFGAEPVTTTAGPSGLALYAGPTEPILGLALVTTPEASLVCGPVGVDNESDFVDRRAGGGSNRDLLGVPWNCLSAADADDLGG